MNSIILPTFYLFTLAVTFVHIFTHAQSHSESVELEPHSSNTYYLETSPIYSGEHYCQYVQVAILPCNIVLMQK